jgi:hypothetical protein
MSTLKIAAVAAAVLGGSLAAAQAQPYGHFGYGPAHGGGYHRPAPPVYVPPRVARKQAQLQERFVEKYGYAQPQYRPHHRPHHWGGHGGYYGGPVFVQPRPRVQYHYGW